LTALKASQTIVRSVDGRFTVSWSGTDNIGVTRYQWRTRSRPEGTPSAMTSTTARSGTFRLGVGSWDLSVRAVDAVNNVSPWKTIRIVVPRDDRAYAFDAGTVRRTATTAYRSTLTTNAKPGSSLALTSDDGTALYVIGRVGPAYGRMRITVDGVSTVVDTGFYKGARATRNIDRVILFSTSLTAGPHTVTITNVGSKARVTVAVDAIAVAR
jgi:hypothetical protein